MGIVLQCSHCENLIDDGDDYVEMYIAIKEWDGSTLNTHQKEYEYEQYCEDCIENINIGKILLEKINKRNPNLDRQKK